MPCRLRLRHSAPAFPRASRSGIARHPRRSTATWASARITPGWRPSGASAAGPLGAASSRRARRPQAFRAGMPAPSSMSRASTGTGPSSASSGSVCV
eukprot:6268005-Alexandrium_andersonii.AAC.1